MSGFFSDESVKNPAAEAPWKRREVDRMLDLYFAGSHPKEIARKLERNPKAVKRRLEQFFYNERDWAERYEPRRRMSRQGKRFTENEQILVNAHRERNIPKEWTARLLARPVRELTGEPQMELAKSRTMRQVAPSLDLIWAHRWLYFLQKKPVISDEAYDALVQEEIEYGGGAAAFAQIKEWKGFAPGYVRDLAMYLLEKKNHETKNDSERRGRAGTCGD